MSSSSELAEETGQWAAVAMVACGFRVYPETVARLTDIARYQLGLDKMSGELMNVMTAWSFPERVLRVPSYSEMMRNAVVGEYEWGGAYPELMGAVVQGCFGDAQSEFVMRMCAVSRGLPIDEWGLWQWDEFDNMEVIVESLGVVGVLA